MHACWVRGLLNQLALIHSERTRDFKFSAHCMPLERMCTFRDGGGYHLLQGRVEYIFHQLVMCYQVIDPKFLQGLLELQKAQRMARLDGEWEKDTKKLQKVAAFTVAYCQGQRLFALVGIVCESLP